MYGSPGRVSTVSSPNIGLTPRAFLLEIADPPREFPADPAGCRGSQIGFGPEWVWREGAGACLWVPIRVVTQGVDIAKPGTRQPGTGPGNRQARTRRCARMASPRFHLDPQSSVETSSQAEDPTSTDQNRVMSSSSRLSFWAQLAGFAWKRWGRRAARRDRGH